MRRLAAWFVGALVLAIGSARARAQDLASAETEPGFVALEGDGSAPRADDLLVEAGILRGPSGRPVLRRDGPRLFEKGDDGKERLVQLEISGGGHDASSAVPVAEALAMPAETIAGLRGISFIDWQPEFGAILSKIDGPRCFVRLTGRVGRTLPELPAGLRALEITGHLHESLDVAPLSRLVDLRRLLIDGYRIADWSPLAGLARLRHLEGEIVPASAPTVPSLPGLVSYDSGFSRDVTDISFVERTPALEIARFCDESDFARMRALAAASRDPKRYGEWIDEVLDRRQNAAERKAAEPKAGESKGDREGAPEKTANPEDAAGGR